VLGAACWLALLASKWYTATRNGGWAADEFHDETSAIGRSPKPAGVHFFASSYCNFLVADVNCACYCGSREQCRNSIDLLRL